MTDSRAPDLAPGTPAEPQHAAASPLWMVTREPALNQLVEYLGTKREELQAAPGERHELRFSESRLAEGQAAFSRMIRSGEEHLHRLAELLCRSLYPQERYGLRSVVVGQMPASEERFTLMQPITSADLYGVTDLDLGTRLLERFRLLHDDSWQKARLVANFVEYEPLEASDRGVHKVISRIKAEEEIWNKVVDEIFRLDGLVQRDKQLRHLSRFVKDIFGVKIVVGSAQRARELQLELEGRAFSAAALDSVDVSATRRAQELSFLEVKDYLGDGSTSAKQSGWRAIKSVVRWDGQLFEIQIQPLRNYHSELERFTLESHEEFKAQRDALRNSMARQIPLFGFYRDLLRWLFGNRSEAPPTFPGVAVIVEE